MLLTCEYDKLFSNICTVLLRPFSVLRDVEWIQVFASEVWKMFWGSQKKSPTEKQYS